MDWILIFSFFVFVIFAGASLSLLFAGRGEDEGREVKELSTDWQTFCILPLYFGILWAIFYFIPETYSNWQYRVFLAPVLICVANIIPYYSTLQRTYLSKKDQRYFLEDPEVLCICLMMIINILLAIFVPLKIIFACVGIEVVATLLSMILFPSIRPLRFFKLKRIFNTKETLTSDNEKVYVKFKIPQDEYIFLRILNIKSKSLSKKELEEKWKETLSSPNLSTEACTVIHTAHEKLKEHFC